MLVSLLLSTASAEPAAHQRVEPFSISGPQAKSSLQWLASLALEKMPRTFDGDKDWGATKQVWAGIKLRRDGYKLKTNRRFRELEHGRWVRYELTLPETTAANAASVTIQEVFATTDPATGDQRWKIDWSAAAPMQFTARIQRWNLGVKLYSVTIMGDLRVRLTSSTTIGLAADYAEIPPALVIDPRVTEAELALERFEVDRVSRIGGDAAEQWGELMEEIVVERFIEKQNERLVTRLNQLIDEERDELRLSLADWLEKLMVDPALSP